MPWQIALLIYFVCFVAQALLQRTYSQKSKLPESMPPALSYLYGVTPLGIIVGLFIPHHVHWTWRLCGLLLIEGAGIGLFNILSFQAIKRLPMARFETLFQSYEVVVIILGWTLLAEKLNIYQIAGAVLIAAAALLAVRAPKSSSKELHTAVKYGPVALTLLSALALGIGLVAEKAALRHMDMGAYFIFGYLTQTLSLLVIAAKDLRLSTLKQFRAYDAKRSIGMGILSALIGFFYIVAIVRSDNVTLITALAAFTLPLIMLAGRFVLRERENEKILWAAVSLGCAGLLLSAL